MPKIPISQINDRILAAMAEERDTYGADAVLSSVGVHYSANPLQAG